MKISDRFSRHRYDFKNRPLNNVLSTHLNSEPHDFEKDFEITILDRGYESEQQRKRSEDKFICQLGTCAPNGLNKDLGSYGRELYSTYQALN